MWHESEWRVSLVTAERQTSPLMDKHETGRPQVGKLGTMQSELVASLHIHGGLCIGAGRREGGMGGGGGGGVVEIEIIVLQ